jgi:tetratricopeptide (TPR) repeat protein
VFFVAENHADAKDFARTIAHEITGHLGIETTIGEAGMKALVNKINSQMGGVMALADKLGVGQDAQAAYNAAKRIGKTDAEANAAAVREMIAHTEEHRPDKNFLQKANEFIKAMVGAVRSALRKMGVDLDISSSDIYKMLRDARNDFKEMSPGAYVNKDGDIQFSINPKYNDYYYDTAVENEGLVARKKSLWQQIRGEATGLIFRTKYIDRFAPIEKVLEPMKDSLKATQAMYYLRMHDQRMAFTSEVASHGALHLVEKKRADGSVERVIESKESANLKQMAEALREANVGNHEAAVELFTQYMLAKRAMRVGFDKLNYKDQLSEQKLMRLMDKINADKQTKAAFEKASDIYNEYNKGLIDFAVKTGAVSKEAAADMLKHGDYVPYYRQNKDGDIILEVGGAVSMRVGNLKDQPYLHELVGGEQPIFDIFTSALQNTSMLTDMALRNLATRNVAFTLQELGLLEIKLNKEGKPVNGGITPGRGDAGAKTIRFKIDGEEQYAVVNSDAAGVPAEILVKGLEGVHTALPTAVKMMNYPANMLRKWVTRNPAYALRQIARDPINAVMVSGANTMPIISSLKEISKMISGKSTGEPMLQHRGILGGQVLTGTSEDQRKILLEITSGKKGWNSALAKLDELAIQGDAATRVVMYNSFIKQGLSDMEATLATLEAMNFSKRGTSPSLFAMTTMVPFMNAQIQGLDVLYKAFTGKMPFNEKLKIKQKLLQRAIMMTGFTMLYAAMMSDDDAYVNANDTDRLNNWFVYVPGFDEPVKVPIPFELGLIFKAVPESLMIAARGDRDTAETVKALGSLAWNAVPISGPQGIKPALEVMLNHSFYTNGDIESKRLQQYEAGERYNERTTEAAKMLGTALNISPIKIEYLIKGYTGALPLAAVSLTNPVLRSGEAATPPEGRSSDLPVFGSLFQQKDAQGLVTRAYKDMEDINRIKETYDKYEEEGRYKEADALLDAKADIIGMSSFAGRFRKEMGELFKEERSIRSDPTMDPKEKRKLLDEIRQDKIQLAKDFSAIARE